MGYSVRADDGSKWSQVAEVRPNHEGSRAVSLAEAEANARLIAAAPSLLAEAEEMIEFLITTNIDLTHPRMKALGAIIQKAKGESA